MPLAFPVIAGAGTITTVLSLRAEFDRPNILAAIILNMIPVVLVLLLTNRIERLLGRVGLYCDQKGVRDHSLGHRREAVRGQRDLPLPGALMAAKMIIHTDGAASGNPGPGGYGAVLQSGKHRKELWGGYRLTTNNRMELMAVIAALEALKAPGMDVTVVSDSKYVIDPVQQGWLFGWEKKGFAKKKNPDLWKRFLAVFRQHNVSFQWIKGHVASR